MDIVKSSKDMLPKMASLSSMMAWRQPSMGPMEAQFASAAGREERDETTHWGDSTRMPSFGSSLRSLITACDLGMGEQYQVLCASSCHPASCAASKPSKASSDYVSCLRVETIRRHVVEQHLMMVCERRYF